MPDEAERLTNRIIWGTVNMVMGSAPMTFLFVPITSKITKPDSIVQSLVHALIKLVPSLPDKSITSGRAIPALTTLYIFGLIGAQGLYGVALIDQMVDHDVSVSEPINSEPVLKEVQNLQGFRKQIEGGTVTLKDDFTVFAITAAFAQLLAPEDSQIINLLGLYVLLKLSFAYPAMVLGRIKVSGWFQIMAMATTLNACWRLAAGQ